MIYYIYRENGYKSLLPLNEEYIFENVSLLVVKMKSGKHKIYPSKFRKVAKLLNNTIVLQFRRYKL